MSGNAGIVTLRCSWGNCNKFAFCGDTSGMSIWGMPSSTMCKRQGCHLRAQVNEFAAMEQSALASFVQELAEEYSSIVATNEVPT